MESDIPWKVVVDILLFYNQVFHIYLWWKQDYNHMINRVGKMCVDAMSLCMIVLIVARKTGDGRYYFAFWQTNNNTPNKLLLSESAVSFLLRVRGVSFTSRAKGCIKFVHHNCLVSLKLSHRGSHLLFYLCQIRSHVRILIIMVVIVFRN